jgi:PAS domain S-box-containing protein
MAHSGRIMSSRRAVIGIAAIAMIAISGINLLGIRADREAGERIAFAARNVERETEAAVRMLHHQWRTTETQIRLLHELATDLQIAFRSSVHQMSEETPGEGAAPFKIQELQRAKTIANPHLFIQVTLVDNDAFAIWSSLSRGRIRVDLSDREHIRAVLNEGLESFVGRPVLGRVSGAYTVQFVSANRDHMGHRIGVSVVSLDVVAVRSFLRGLQLGDTDEIVVIRSDGVVVASSRYASIGKVLAPSTTAMLAIREGDGSSEIFARVLSLEELGLARPMLAMAMPTSDMGLHVAVLRDLRDTMAEVEETNAIRARNVRYLQIGIAGIGIVSALGLVVIAHISKLARARSIAEERHQADQHLAMAARLGPGVIYRIGFSDTGAPHFEWVAEAVERVLGYSANEFIQPGMLEGLVDTDTRTTLLDAAGSARQGLSHTMEFRVRRKDGSWRWMHNTLRLCEQAGDRRAMVLGYLVDISAAKEQAHMMGQAAKMVTLGEMTSGMVHEIKLPIATIAVAAENLQHDLALLNDAQAERLRRTVARISKQAARATRLIKHLSIYGRRGEGDDAVASLFDVVDGARVLVDYRLRHSEICVETDLPNDLPMVAGDQLLLEQVLVNLLVNAIDAYDGHTRTPRMIRITGRVDGAYVDVSVSDKGKGIPPDVLERIFEPFFTTKAPGRGTGLGLSFSRHVVANMGGAITVNSSPTETIFSMHLPIAQVRS